MKWLGNAPRRGKGISWGVPWKKGELEINQLGTIQSIGGQPIQNKIMGYWPDGSVKWTGHAAILDENTQLIFGKDEVKEEAEIATEKFNGIYIDNGTMTAYFPKKGEGWNVLDWIKMDGNEKVSDFQTFVQIDSKQTIAKVDEVIIEENGPLKAVVKVTASIREKTELDYQFILRFKFYRNQHEVNINHTVVIGNDQSIEGIALRHQTKLTGDPWNRFAKFSGDSGVYSEPAQLLLSRRHAVENHAYAQQAQGEIVQLTEEHEAMLAHAKENAVWDHFQLTQTSSNQYQIEKQTDEAHTFIKIGSGQRSKGMVYTGGVNGGSAIMVENFWEKYPAALEVKNLTQTYTETTTWLWSPAGGTIDFRHYSKRDHMLSGYEGMEEIRSTPIGIANTNQITLAIFSENAKNEELWQQTLDSNEPPLVVVEPERYYETGVFGLWSLPDKENKAKAFLENQLAHLFDFYEKEIEQRDWYGFWNYGDVMHTYDPYRHMWRYDLGGFAWQNTELVPNMWLWQYFLRTGEERVFRMAEAMTRHTSEVDMYHLGEYQGLGSRHNVLHWGCQCKEARISMAGLHRYYYFLTGDERTKDILDEVADNEPVFDRLEPLREFYESNDQTVPIRVGPDWSALVSNWFTQYELTGNKTYLDYIMTGIQSISNTPSKLLSGPTYQFDRETKELHYFGTGNVGGYHMIISFGAPQVWMELAENIEHEEWRDMLAEFGRFYALTGEEKEEQSEGALNERHFAWPMFATGMMAYAAKHNQDEALAKRAWEILLQPELSGIPIPVENTVQKAMIWKEIEEMPWISTNVVSQWSLNIMLCLELIGEYLPNNQIEKLGERK